MVGNSALMKPLMLHQTCDPGPIKFVTAAITATGIGCEAEFRLQGAIDSIIVPALAASEREDNLWKTTCFEIFWQPSGGTSYREFNLSPSTKWAAYDFDSLREGMRDAPVDAIVLSCIHEPDVLVLKANIAAELPDPAQVALNAIVEHRDGRMQFWALAFPAGDPDFHCETCRQLIIERG